MRESSLWLASTSLGLPLGVHYRICQRSRRVVFDTSRRRKNSARNIHSLCLLVAQMGCEQRLTSIPKIQQGDGLRPTVFALVVRSPLRAQTMGIDCNAPPMNLLRSAAGVKTSRRVLPPLTCLTSVRHRSAVILAGVPTSAYRLAPHLRIVVYGWCDISILAETQKKPQQLRYSGAFLGNRARIAQVSHVRRQYLNFRLSLLRCACLTMAVTVKGSGCVLNARHARGGASLSEAYRIASRI